MANARLRELRLISALIRTDPRRALAQVRDAADRLAKRPPPPAEQLPLPKFPRAPFLAKPEEPSPLKQRCENCPHKAKQHPGPQQGHGRNAPRYDSPDARVFESMVGWVMCSDDTSSGDAAFHAAKERFWRAVQAHPRWLKRETSGTT